MRQDADRLTAMAGGREPPTLRLFQFSEPTVSYGRLQHLETLRHVAPAGWPLVQRPTGGGIVLHNADRCFSLCWRRGTAPMPESPKAVYAWIHRAVFQALAPLPNARLASCRDAKVSGVGFHKRFCFQEPVGYDILSEEQKILGGALAFQRSAVLYQGTLQRKEAVLSVDALMQALTCCA